MAALDTDVVPLHVSDHRSMILTEDADLLFDNLDMQVDLADALFPPSPSSLSYKTAPPSPPTAAPSSNGAPSPSMTSPSMQSSPLTSKCRQEDTALLVSHAKHFIESKTSWHSPIKTTEVAAKLLVLVAEQLARAEGHGEKASLTLQALMDSDRFCCLLGLH